VPPIAILWIPGCPSYNRALAHRVLNVAMPEIGLQSARVVSGIRESKAAGVAQHVGMCFEREPNPARSITLRSRTSRLNLLHDLGLLGMGQGPMNSNKPQRPAASNMPNGSTALFGRFSQLASRRQRLRLKTAGS
jgi:hypothetical protein